MLQYIKNVLSGRIRHWNLSENVVITELLDRINNLPAPPTQIMFKTFLAMAHLTSKDLLLDNRGRKSGLNIDVKKINVQQFRDYYCILLSFLLFAFFTTFQSSRDELRQSLLVVTSNWELTERILNSLAIANARAGADFIHINMDSLVFATWKEIVKVIGFGNERDPGQMVFVGMMLAGTYKAAESSIIYKAELVQRAYN